MKKMKSLKQQVIAVLSLALVVTTITLGAPEQALANHKGRFANVRQRNKVAPHRGTVTPNNHTVRRNGYSVSGGGDRPVENFSLNAKKAKTRGKWVWDDTCSCYIWM